jgi:thiamine pyrophosphate-dependent acetolactate synthase large subunit-like protein
VHNHRGASQDHGALAPSDLTLLCDADAAVAALLVALPELTPKAPPPPAAATSAPRSAEPGVLSIGEVGRVVADALADVDVCFTRFPFTWDTAAVQFHHPLDSIGYDGGSGIGSGPGITVGAGLALLGSDRLPVAITGDGDFLMGNTAIWTAAHHGIPCVFVVCNNRSFYTDERHQAYVANARGRPLERQWIGSRLEGPDIDIAGMARAQGAAAVGPVGDAAALRTALDEAVAAARAGGPAVVDVLVAKPPGAWPADRELVPPQKWQRLRSIKRRLR